MVTPTDLNKTCSRVHDLARGLRRFRFPFELKQILTNGIYLLFEEGEIGHGADRIVRIGTHTGTNQLPSRLRQHFTDPNKDRSIFRKNIGRALLAKDDDSFLELWEIDLTTRSAKQKRQDRIDKSRLAQVETRVTEYIQAHFTFVVFEVQTKEQRLYWESKVISTIAGCDECGSSPSWLGNHSPKHKIRESGLWLVNELNKEPLTNSEFEQLTRLAL